MIDSNGGNIYGLSETECNNVEIASKHCTAAVVKKIKIKLTIILG